MVWANDGIDYDTNERTTTKEATKISWVEITQWEKKAIIIIEFWKII